MESTPNFIKNQKDSNPKSLSSAKAQELLMGIYKEYTKIEQMDFRLKALIIEQLQVARYEILILSGRYIPSLYSKCQDEAEKIAFVKAYYNLTNSAFLCNSEYFKMHDHMSDDDYLTACLQINQKILELKKRN